MANSGTVASGQQATAAHYNNLRADVLDPTTGHDHSGATDHGMLLPKGRSLYGDGSDGDVTISGSTTLSRPMFYNNLTVNVGVTLSAAGWPIYVRGTLTLNGTISTKGNDAVGNAIGADTWTTASAFFSPGLRGGLGTTGTGVGNACPYGQSGFMGGLGGVGGSANANAGGGTGSTGYPLVAARGGAFLASGVVGNTTSQMYAMGGGIGGGGGAAAGSGTAGSGGGAGGAMFLAARIVAISATGVLTAKGGNGGNATAGYAGGGGGGGGGCIVGFYDQLTNAGTITASGGSGGTGLGGGLSGGTGSPGTLAFIQQ